MAAPIPFDGPLIKATLPINGPSFSLMEGRYLSERWAILINLTGLDVFCYQAGLPQG
jgi:hypothetical protein